MVFSCIPFLYFFLPISLILYYISPNKLKNAVLCAVSLLFYAWGEPKYVFIMLLSSLIDYTAGLVLDIYRDEKKIRLIALCTSVTMNIGLLAVFKYFGAFVSTSVNALFGTDVTIALPLGISFFTFQTMSYTIDMYMGNIKVQKNPVDFLCYVSMFPQIVAGPIVRYEDVEKQMNNRNLSISKAGEGVGDFIKGLAKKVLLANNVGMLWDEIKVLDYSQLSVVGAWIGIIAFSMQIYYDFSGYSDMAVGLGKMLGFDFPQNFNHPYTSKSISEFWRRWHITLGTWFRLYVYIPLGGNRKGKARTIINLLIVWSLTGLWHGASMKFVAWGAYFGVLIILERFVYGNLLQKLPKLMQIAYSYVLVLFGWVLFECTSFTKAIEYIGAMFGASHTLISASDIYRLRIYGIILVICFMFATSLYSKITKSLASQKNTRTAIYVAAPVVQMTLLIICTAYLVNNSYNPFLYFRF